VSTGFQVVISEVHTAARIFQRESGLLSDLVPSAGLDVPDGGDATINTALSDVLRAAGLTTSQLAAVADGEGRKLRAAGERYEDAEHQNLGLIGRIGG
jgi:hypothetical protein